MTLPFDLHDELAKLRALELAALEADNAVLRQRCKIFPPLEHEINRLLEDSSLRGKVNRIMRETVDRCGSLDAAAKSLRIGRATFYKHGIKSNGKLKLLSLFLLIGLTGCLNQPPAIPNPESRDFMQRRTPSSISAQAETIPATASVTLQWDPSPDAEVTGYQLYHGAASGTYTNAVDVGTNCIHTLKGMIQGAQYYFAATAYNALGAESVFSQELVYTIPVGVRYLLVTEAASDVSGPWLAFRTNTVISTNLFGFFRQKISKP